METPKEESELRQEAVTEPLKEEPITGGVEFYGPNWKAIKAILSPTGGSILYCLSALSIIYGLYKLITPTLGSSDVFGEILPCFLVLGVYEWSLLGVLALIVIWRHVHDDAISLVLLVALFLIGSGLALGTISLNGPGVSLVIGIACFALGVAQVHILRRYIHVRWERLAFVGMGLVLLWNFLISPYMSWTIAGQEGTDEIRQHQWLLGWLVLLAGGFLIWLEATRRKDSHGFWKQDFLHTPAMAILAATLVLAACGVHQYYLAWIYEVDYTWGDWLWLFLLLCFLLVELARSLMHRPQAVAILLAALPGAAVLYAISAGAIDLNPDVILRAWWNPFTILLFAGGFTLWLIIRNWWPRLGYVLLGYLHALVLTSSYAMDGELNWYACNLLLIITLVILGIVHRQPGLWILASLAVAAAIGVSQGGEAFCLRHDIEIVSLIVGTAGLGFMITGLVFPQRDCHVVRIVAAVLLNIVAFDYLLDGSGWGRAVWVLLLTIGLCVVLWMRVRDAVTGGIALIPTAYQIYLLVLHLSYWIFVIISFGLLGFGTIVSLHKGRKKPLTETP